MKQRDLVKKLEKAGFEFARHGGIRRSARPPPSGIKLEYRELIIP